MGLFPIVQTSIDGRGYSSMNKAAWKSFDVEVWWTCLRFIVSCVFPFEWPTRMSDKESTIQRTAQRNEMVGLDGSSQGSNAGLVLHWAIRLDEPETKHRNLEYSTESEPEERRQEKPGCSCSAKWKLGWCSIRLCFLDVVPCNCKEDTTPSLFRTRFVRCYALPCISIKLWRSTCKPYLRGTISMVTKWRIVWLQTIKKGKSTKTLYENEIRKKYGRLSRQTPCLRQPRYLLRSFSSVFERVFMVTSKKWRAAAVLTAVLSRGKAVRKMRNKTRNSLLCFPT